MSILACVGAALVSGALLALALGLQPLWWAAWIAPIPLLVATLSASGRGALALGALAGLLSTSSLFSYLAELASAPVAALVCVQSGLMWAVVASLTRAAARALPAWAAVLVFPALLAGLDTVTAFVSPHGTGGSLAHSQMDFLPALQVAAFGGTPAIVFLVSLLPSLAALAVHRRGRSESPWLAYGLPSLLILVALGFGAARVARAPRAETVCAALLAMDRFEGVSEDWNAVWTEYVPALEAAAAAGARIVVLPEKIAVVREAEADAALVQIAGIARRLGSDIVVGVVAAENGRAFNRAFLVDRTGGVQSYDKRHMVPGFEEDMTPGSGDLIAALPDGRVGVAICKDLDFPPLGRSYGRAGVEMLLVPAWDFDRDAWLHSRMAMLRAVESGFTLARSARNGFMTVSDRYGRVLAEARSEKSVTRLLADVPRAPGRPTLYARIGDAFGWACVAGSVIGITVSSGQIARWFRGSPGRTSPS